MDDQPEMSANPFADDKVAELPAGMAQLLGGMRGDAALSRRLAAAMLGGTDQLTLALLMREITASTKTLFNTLMCTNTDYVLAIIDRFGYDDAATAEENAEAIEKARKYLDDRALAQLDKNAEPQ